MKAVVSSIWKSLLRYPIAIPITVVLIVLAIIIVLSGHKFQIGGILEKLWGKKKADDKRATPPKDRVNENGKLIQPGESDDRGFVHAPVKTDIKEPGIFSDPNTVVIIDEGKNIEIPLPRGVSNEDVQEVIRISPQIYEIHNNDGGISTYELDSLINEIDK